MVRQIPAIIAFIICILLIWFFLALPNRHVYGRDLDGKYAQSPLKQWFDSLASKRGSCCSFADGLTLKDIDWDIRDDGHYAVRLDDGWHIVPDDSVLTVPNKYGSAVVWPWKDSGGEWQIRCFIPGAGT